MQSHFLKLFDTNIIQKYFKLILFTSAHYNLDFLIVGKLSEHRFSILIKVRSNICWSLSTLKGLLCLVLSFFFEESIKINLRKMFYKKIEKI